MPHHVLRYIHLLKILHVFIRQLLPFHIQSLINPVDLTEANDRTADTLVIQPCKSDVAHLPAFLRRQLFHTTDGLDIGFGKSRLASRAGGIAVDAQGPSELALSEWTPL